MLQFSCKALLLAVLLAPASHLAARDDPATSVKDLQYGEMLFYYFQQDYFNSIVHLGIAQQQDRLPNHANEAELMMGGLLLSYGMRNNAREIFQGLLDDESNDLSVHNRAWLYLAKISYQRGDLAGALDAITHVAGKMTPATRTATANLHSLLLLQQGRNAEAIELLESTRSGKHWTPYLKYNLGIARIRNGEREDGVQELAGIAKYSNRSAETSMLRDKANLALGYSLLQSGETGASRQALEQVRLEGPLSNKALLGAGWASADADDYNRALVPWTELSTRDPADPAVQESLLAVPYALTKMELFGRAVQKYKQSIEALNDEKINLDKSIIAIRDGQLLRYLQEYDAGTGDGWLQKLNLEADSPALRYQLSLMASHDFQEAVKNYRDLAFLEKNLVRWNTSITAYDDMLASRQSRYASQLPAANHVLQNNPLPALQQQQVRLQERLRQAEARGDIKALANSNENSQLQTLSSIKKQLAELPDTSEKRELQKKQRLLYGVIYWQLSNEYKARLWKTRQQLSEVEGLTRQTDEAIGKLQQAGLDTTSSFSGFESRIATQKSLLGDLRKRTDKAVIVQGELLQQLAINELKAQKKRIDIYIVQARFALAQTYDSSLNNAAGRLPQ
jgi:hypothetical protein